MNQPLSNIASGSLEALCYDTDINQSEIFIPLKNLIIGKGYAQRSHKPQTSKQEHDFIKKNLKLMGGLKLDDFNKLLENAGVTRKLKVAVPVVDVLEIDALVEEKIVLEAKLKRLNEKIAELSKKIVP